MRLWARSGVPINLSSGSSRAVGSASDTSNDKVQSDFREKGCQTEKTTLPEAPSCIAEFFYVTVRYPPPG